MQHVDLQILRVSGFAEFCFIYLFFYWSWVGCGSAASFQLIREVLKQADFWNNTAFI